MIDDQTGKVLGGMGGKFNGVDIRRTRKEFRQNPSEKSQSKKEEPKQDKKYEVSPGHDHIPSGQEMKILRETSKAVLVDNPAFENYWDDDERIMARMRGESPQIWLPKSAISTHEDQVVGMAGWLARKNGIKTVEGEEANKKAREESKARYAKTLEQAKNLGVKGVREGMRLETINSKIREFKQQNGIQPSGQDRLQELLDRGKLWEKAGLSRVYMNPDAMADFLGLKFTMHPKKSRVAANVETGDPDRNFTPTAANDLYQALDDIYYDNVKKKFVMPKGLSLMRGWLPEWLEKRLNSAIENAKAKN